ncbi:MAG TPA: hypothetical protein PKA76_17975, partial [Pirellulaceae bacterium]|nr:hypothetical protein [Pirellulaceae bacterium]
TTCLSMPRTITDPAARASSRALPQQHPIPLRPIQTRRPHRSRPPPAARRSCAYLADADYGPLAL